VFFIMLGFAFGSGCVVFF